MNYFTILINDADCSCAMFVRRGPAGRYVKYDLSGRTATDMMIIERPNQDDISGSTLIVPITQASTQAIFDLHDQARMVGDSGNGAGIHPYYFSADMSLNPKFERAGRIPVDFTGREQPVTYEQQAIMDASPEYKAGLTESARQKLADDIPFTRMNCWTHGLYLLNFIAEANLAEIDPALPDIERAFEAHEWFEALDKRPEARKLFEPASYFSILSEYKTAGGHSFFKTHIMPLFLNDAATMEWRDENGKAVEHPLAAKKPFGIPDRGPVIMPQNEPDLP